MPSCFAGKENDTLRIAIDAIYQTSSAERTAFRLTTLVMFPQSIKYFIESHSLQFPFVALVCLWLVFICLLGQYYIPVYIMLCILLKRGMKRLVDRTDLVLETSTKFTGFTDLKNMAHFRSAMNFGPDSKPKFVDP